MITNYSSYFHTHSLKSQGIQVSSVINSGLLSRCICSLSSGFRLEKSGDLSLCNCNNTTKLRSILDIGKASVKCLTEKPQIMPGYDDQQSYCCLHSYTLLEWRIYPIHRFWSSTKNSFFDLRTLISHTLNAITRCKSVRLSIYFMPKSSHFGAFIPSMPSKN